MRRASWTLTAILLVFVLSACTGGSPAANGPQPTRTPSFSGGPKVDAPAGAHATDVEIVVSPLPEADISTLGITPAAPAFDIALSDGSQPRLPVRITQTIDPSAGEHLVFMTKDSGTGKWSGIPSEIRGGTAAVELAHFSWGFFAWVDSSMEAFNEQLQKFLKWQFDPPACHNKRAKLDGYEVTAKASENSLYACVAEDRGRLRLTIHSNSPFTWDVFPTGGAVGEQPRPGVDAVAIAGTALFGLGANYNFANQTVQFPGGSTSVLGATGDVSFGAEARLNPTYHLAYVTMNAVEMYLQVLGSNSEALEWKNVAECASEVVTGVEEAGPVAQAILRCTAAQLHGADAVALGALAALPSLLGSMILGAITEATGKGSVTLTVVPVQSPTPSRTPSTPTATVSTAVCGPTIAQIRTLTGHPEAIQQSMKCSTDDPAWASATLEMHYNHNPDDSRIALVFFRRVNGKWTRPQEGNGFHGGSMCSVLEEPSFPADLRAGLPC